MSPLVGKISARCLILSPYIISDVSVSKASPNVDGFIGNKSGQADNAKFHSASMAQSLNL